MQRTAEIQLAAKNAERKKQILAAVSQAASKSGTATERENILRNHGQGLKRIEEIEEQERLAMKAALQERLATKKRAAESNRKLRAEALAQLADKESHADAAQLVASRAENECLANMLLNRLLRFL